MDLQELLRESVDGQVRDVPAGFADGAIRRVRRRRTRVALASVAGAMLVGAAAATFAMIGPAEPDRNDGAPADRSSSGYDVDLAALPDGPAPALPWYADGHLHIDNTATAFDVEFAAVSLYRVAGGFVVLATEPNGRGAGDPRARTLYSVREGGAPVTLASGPIRGVAVAGLSGQAAVSTADTVSVVDVATGTVLYALETPDDETTPVGFLDGERVLLRTGTGALLTWDVGGGYARYLEDRAIDRLSSAGGPAVLAPGGRLLAITPSATATDVLDTGTGHVLWSRPPAVLTFSPDGRYAALLEAPVPPGVIPSDLDGAEPGDLLERNGPTVTVTQEMLDTVAEHPDDWEKVRHVVIMDARTGAEVRRLTAENAENLRWETGTSVVFGAYRDGEEAALIRCSVDGACELTTQPREVVGEPGVDGNPYLLGDTP
ncbi:WD40 repeat domain-containing protein [Jiangella asiatica]|uniref:WD40 repeat domain-containing protein n=1 Tax=Jiangella asiatica TaxID=2530372 RepID=A0A4R5CF58_9ACTN|nr:hypothetical protein [Jiangella asiatica]TDD98215.1 hypothetical protein E1269_29165 [Jiangella asiatica]